MSNEDPPSKRVKPLPIQLLHHAQALVDAAPDAEKQATMDMAWIGYYHLLRPGEYCKSRDNKPLRLLDVGLCIGNHALDPCTCPLDDIDRANHSSFEFQDQKNWNKGEIIAHTISGHMIACPTRAIARRVRALRENFAPPGTPLCSYKRNGHWTPFTSTHITKILQISATLAPQLGISPADITARSLRAGGAMALLCGCVDPSLIKLVGRWKSEAMFRYLYAQALPLIRNLASTMLEHGTFTLAPGASTPAHATALLIAAAEAGSIHSTH